MCYLFLGMVAKKNDKSWLFVLEAVFLGLSVALLQQGCTSEEGARLQAVWIRTKQILLEVIK